MKYAKPLLVFFTAAALAQDDTQAAYDYFARVCQPRNATGYPDFNAPCNVIYALEAQCIYGPDYLNQLLDSISQDGDSSGEFGFTDSDSPPMQSNETQRICFCESQFFDQAAGCTACGVKHGNPVADLGVGDADNLASLSSSYCAASNTPTAGFADILFDYGNSLVAALPTTTAGSSSFSDPLGNMTQVSLYYTPKVTGTSAWVVAEQTGASGTVTAVNTQDGQIRPTAGGAASGSADAGADTTTSGNAAIRTEAVAAAGVIGLAGLMALL